MIDVKAVRAISLSVCLLVCACAGGAAAQESGIEIPAKDYVQTYFQSFKGSGARPEGWNFANRISEEYVQYEPAGLRITMPPGRATSAGIVADLGVKGDFEMTLSFEVLKDPDPADVGSGTRFTLAVTLDTPLLDTPKQEVATLNRSMGTKGFVTWVRNRHRPDPFGGSFQTPATTGRLRYIRKGDELIYLASVGANQPFTFLAKYRFGAEDLKRIRITGSTGSEKALMDVRVTDFRIRADAIPGAPASEAEGAPLAAASAVAAPPRGGGGLWLMLGLVLALMVATILALGLLLYKRSRAARSAPDDSATFSTVACPKCARVLKPKPEMAGKKVKCARCGAAVLVPAACLFFALCLAAAPAYAQPPVAAKKYAKEDYFDFRGKPLPPEMMIRPAGAEQFVRSEPEGLRVTLPRGRDIVEPVKVSTRFGVQGDFEITATVEILRAGKLPSGAWGVGPALFLRRVDPTNEGASFSRLSRADGKEVVFWDLYGKPGEVGESQPCPDKLVRLRIERKGTQLAFLLGKGAEGENFEKLSPKEFGRDDIDQVTLRVLTGKKPFSVDVRLIDLRIRSDPPAPDPNLAALPAAAGPRNWLVAALIVAPAVIAVLVLVFLLRKRGRAASKAPATVARAIVSFACPQCARGLNIKPEMVGKKVKCADCGAVVLVPVG